MSTATATPTVKTTFAVSPDFPATYEGSDGCLRFTQDYRFMSPWCDPPDPRRSVYVPQEIRAHRHHLTLRYCNVPENAVRCRLHRLGARYNSGRWYVPLTGPDQARKIVALLADVCAEVEPAAVELLRAVWNSIEEDGYATR